MKLMIPYRRFVFTQMEESHFLAAIPVDFMLRYLCGCINKKCSRLLLQ